MKLFPIGSYVKYKSNNLNDARYKALINKKLKVMGYCECKVEHPGTREVRVHCKAMHWDGFAGYLEDFKLIDNEPPKNEVEWLDRVRDNFKED